MEKKTKILVVEDNPVTLNDVSRLLQSAGYEVREATTGSDALKMINLDKPDIILLDTYLPDRVGYDLCRQIKSTSGFEDISIIYLSSTPTSDDMKMVGFDIGADEYIERPIGEKEFLGRIRAIERMHKTEMQLRESEERYRITIEYSNDGVVLIKDNTYLYINERFLKMFGYKNKEDALKNNIYNNVHPEDREGLREFMSNVEEALRPPRLYEFRGVRQDGATIYIEASITHITYQGELAILAFLRDVTERRVAEETIRRLAYHDALTGLPNRVLMSDRLTVAMARAERTRKKLALMMLDLDKFKEVNDTLGHATGDLLLKAVAERLTQSLRKNDTVSRQGGDEFIVILPDLADKNDAGMLAQKILHLFHKPFHLVKQTISISTSIGIALYPDDGITVDELIKHADIAMYEAKKKGRNQYQYYVAESSFAY
jgi:diguanylate cyclase (GGDEF)-like protein/PAS domain S-box-containing protein